MKYAVITNTYRRPVQLVERSLKASLGQSIPPVRVILMDQNDIPLQLDPAITGNILFTKQEQNLKAVSAARNAVSLPADAEWLFFCDDDGFPAPDYSEKLAALMSQHPQIEIFAGSIMRDDNDEFYTLRQRKGGSLKNFHNTKLLMGSNFVIKKEVFLSLGKFDEKFGAGSFWGSGEETDLGWNAFFSGIKMEYFPGLKVYHVPPYTERSGEAISKSFRYGIGKGALVYKWLIRKKKSVVLYELAEMFFLVPPFQFVKGVVTLRFALCASAVSAVAGRLYGFLLSFFRD